MKQETNKKLPIMVGTTVMYKDKVYAVAEWVAYRLDWYEVQLKAHSGYHRFWLREKDLTIVEKDKET